MSQFFAVAGQNAGTVESLNGAGMSVRPMILAEGDDLESVEDEAVKAAGHEDVRVWDRTAGGWA